MFYHSAMFAQLPPKGEKCEECDEIIEQNGTNLSCPNGCFEDDIRNYLKLNYR